jgi:hypothetical protein
MRAPWPLFRSCKGVFSFADFLVRGKIAMQPAEVEPKYAAFISYSHKDEVIARWLHRKLEGFRAPLGLPTVGRQLGKIFRDREEFAAGRDLRSEIQNALRQSNAVVVLCSEHSASSSHVDAEIRFFKETYPDRLIIPVIVGAEPPMCFPPALATGEDRLGADFRPTKDGKHRGYLKVVAGLLGLGLDDLIQRERIARVRRLVLGGAVMAALATAVVSAAYFYDDSVSSGKLSRRSATQVDIIQSDAARARLQARFAAEELARQRETMHEVDERRLITMSRTLSQRDIREAFSAEVVAAAREALWRSDVVDPGSGAPGTVCAHCLSRPLFGRTALA